MFTREDLEEAKRVGAEEAEADLQEAGDALAAAGERILELETSLDEARGEVVLEHRSGDEKDRDTEIWIIDGRLQEICRPRDDSPSWVAFEREPKPRALL